MPYTPVDAVYTLNSYLFKVLEANLGWLLSDYDGGNPFIPSAQQPELMATGKPFIVYGSARQPEQHLYALKTESISYSIYSSDGTEANKIANLLAKALEGQDEAATRINQHIDDEAPSRIIAGLPPRGVAFCSVKTTMTEKAEPEDQEGGYKSALVMAEIRYIEYNDNAQLTDFTYS